MDPTLLDLCHFVGYILFINLSVYTVLKGKRGPDQNSGPSTSRSSLLHIIVTILLHTLRPGTQ